MSALKLLLILFTAAIFAYTGVTMAQHGADFVSVFFGVVFSGTWLGQFTFDFSLYLAVSALWIAWRGGFAPGALAMAATAGILGMIVFAPYLLFALQQAGGDPRRLLLRVHG